MQQHKCFTVQSHTELPMEKQGSRLHDGHQKTKDVSDILHKNMTTVAKNAEKLSDLDQRSAQLEQHIAKFSTGKRVEKFVDVELSTKPMRFSNNAQNTYFTQLHTEPVRVSINSLASSSKSEDVVVKESCCRRYRYCICILLVILILAIILGVILVL